MMFSKGQEVGMAKVRLVPFTQLRQALLLGLLYNLPLPALVIDGGRKEISTGPDGFYWELQNIVTIPQAAKALPLDTPLIGCVTIICKLQ